MVRKIVGCLAVAAFALAGCGGSNVTYYKLATTASGPIQGSNCPTTGNVIETYAGIDGNGEVAIWAQPGGGYLLDLGGGTGYTGTMSGGNYVFNGSDLFDNHGNPDTQITTSQTWTLTPNGAGLTGTYLYEQKCSGAQNSCSFQGATAANSYDCHQSANLTAAQLPGPSVVAPVGAAGAGGPSAPASNGG